MSQQNVRSALQVLQEVQVHQEDQDLQVLQATLGQLDN